MSFTGGFGERKDLVFKKKKKGKKPVLIARNKDTINELNGSLKRQPKFSKMILYSVGCINKLAVDEVSAEEIIMEGTVEQFMEILRKNPDNEKVHTEIHKCLKKLAKTERLAKMIAERMGGRFDPFLHSLNEHKSPETLIATCGTIAQLAKKGGKEVVGKMARQNMAAALCHVINNNKGNVEVVAAATEALERLAHDPSQVGPIIQSGAVPTIVKLASENLDNEPFVESTASLLAGLAKNGGKDGIEKLKKTGAVDFLVNALEAHPYNDELLESATEALKYLTGVSDMGMALASVTGGDVRTDARTAAAMARIAALALVPENVDYMHREHGIDWLLNILKDALGKDGPEASKILSNGCRIIQRTARNEDDTYNMMKKGTVPLLMKILDQHGHDEAVTESALNALASMATRKENAAYLNKKGALDAALKALKEHPKSEPIARGALNLFQAMASYPDTGNELVKKGGIPAIIETMRNHRDNPEILQRAIQTLGRLATSEDNVKEMVKAGLLPELLNVLKNHPYNPDLCHDAMRALDTAMLLPDTAEQLRKLGAIDDIDNVMQCNPNDGDIQTLGQKLIDDIKAGGEREMMEAMERARKAKLAEEERRRKAEAEEARKQMELLEAERGRAMAAEQARLREMEEKRRAEAEDRARREKAEKERLAEMARLQAAKQKRLEQEKLDKEMAEALEAMKASEESARLRKMREEQARLDDEQKAKHAAEMEAQRLKALRDQEQLDELARRRADLERMRRELSKEKEKSKEGAIHELLARQEAEKNKKKKKVKLKKSARDIFDVDEEKDKQLAVLPNAIKNFLMAGQLLTKHSKTAAPKPMHLYLSHDLEYMIWKSPDKEVQMKQRMRIYKLHGVNTGRCTPQLQRKRYGQFLAKEDCCFSMYGADLFDEERTVDLETETKRECQTWVHALEVLIAYAKNRQMYGHKTMKVMSKKELSKMGHKHKLEDSDSEEDDDGMVMNSMAELMGK